MKKHTIQIGDEVREMTESEIAEWRQIAEEYETQLLKIKTDDENRKSARAKLAALGLTEAEVAALLGA